MKKLKIIENILQGDYRIKIFQMYISQITVMLLGFTYNLFLSKSVSIEDYGTYRYFINFYSFSSSLSLMGIQYSIMRLVATSKEQKNNTRLIVASLLLNFIFSILLSTILILTSRLMKFNFLEEGVVFFSLFLWIPSTIILIQSILQGLNKIKFLSIFNICVPLIQILMYGISYVLNIRNSIISIYLISYALLIVFTIIKLKFYTFNIKKEIKQIILENKTTGFPVYIGSIFTVSMTYFLNLIIKDYSTIEKYSQFGLALVLASPLTFISSSFATVLYKNMTKNTKIDKKIIFSCIGIALIALFFYIILINILFKYFYGLIYLPAKLMTIFLGVTYTINGVGDLFNRFILAKGYGKDLRNNTIGIGIIMIFISYFFILKYSIWGLIISKLLLSIIYLIRMYYLYKNKINYKEG